MLRELQYVRPRGSSVLPEKGQAFIIVYNLVSLHHLHSTPQLHISPSEELWRESKELQRESPRCDILTHVPRNNTFWLAQEERNGAGGGGFLELLRSAGKRALSQRAGHKEGKGSGLQGARFSLQLHSSNTQHSSQGRGNYTQRFGG